MKLNLKAAAHALAFCTFAPVALVFALLGFVLGLLWNVILDGSTYAESAINSTLDFLVGDRHD